MVMSIAVYACTNLSLVAEVKWKMLGDVNSPKYVCVFNIPIKNSGTMVTIAPLSNQKGSSPLKMRMVSSIKVD